MSIDLDPETKKWLKKHIGRCDALARATIQLQLIYADENTSDDQRGFLETTIGAGLWYISSKGVPTNKVSKEMLKDYHPDSGVTNPKHTEDHEYPRKVAAKEMLEKDWSNVEKPEFELFTLYSEKYGRVNFVTSTENKRLTKFQKVGVFTTPERAYEQAGIKLIEVTDEELQKVLSRNQEIIEKLSNNV